MEDMLCGVSMIDNRSARYFFSIGYRNYRQCSRQDVTTTPLLLSVFPWRDWICICPQSFLRSFCIRLKLQPVGTETLFAVLPVYPSETLANYLFIQIDAIHKNHSHGSASIIFRYWFYTNLSFSSLPTGKISSNLPKGLGGLGGVNAKQANFDDFALVYNGQRITFYYGIEGSSHRFCMRGIIDTLKK